LYIPPFVSRQLFSITSLCTIVDIAAKEASVFGKKRI
jgi:hypothetical protein